jgi:hypothetical protein
VCTVPRGNARESIGPHGFPCMNARGFPRARGRQTQKRGTTTTSFPSSAQPFKKRQARSKPTSDARSIRLDQTYEHLKNQWLQDGTRNPLSVKSAPFHALLDVSEQIAPLTQHSCENQNAWPTWEQCARSAGSPSAAAASNTINGPQCGKLRAKVKADRAASLNSWILLNLATHEQQKTRMWN